MLSVHPQAHFGQEFKGVFTPPGSFLPINPVGFFIFLKQKLKVFLMITEWQL